MLDDESCDLSKRSEIDLQKQRPVPGTEAVALASPDAPVHRLLRSAVRSARDTSGHCLAACEIFSCVGAVHLELEDPGNRFAGVGRCGDIQPDKSRFDRIDHVGRRPGIAGALADELASHGPPLLGGLPESLLHLVQRLALADRVDECRLRQTAPCKSMGSESGVDTMSEEHHGGKEREHVDPQSAFRKERRDEARPSRWPRPAPPAPKTKRRPPPRYRPPIR